VCDKIISGSGVLCISCWTKVDFITDPKCKLCGFPFEFNIGAELECAICVKVKPYFDSAFSLFKYNEYTQPIIYKLKYNDKIHVAKYLAQLLIRRVGDLSSYDYIVPVPMHRKRLRKRLYNQAALLAKDITRYSVVKFVPNLLIKTRYVSPQTGLKFKNRQENVKNSFSVNEESASLVNGRSIVLIDDVYTTGATVNECSKLLKQYGCKNVKVVTVARVCKPLRME
jgi:ComF family protein